LETKADSPPVKESTNQTANCRRWKFIIAGILFWGKHCSDYLGEHVARGKLLKSSSLGGRLGRLRVFRRELDFGELSAGG
jgi:hypothetical protein